MLQIAVKAMESEQTKLDRVLKILGFLYQHFDGVTDAKVRQVMLEGLESRFADYDQPVLLIAYMLNPHRRLPQPRMPFCLLEECHGAGGGLVQPVLSLCQGWVSCSGAVLAVHESGGTL